MDSPKQNLKVTIENAENGVCCTVCYGMNDDHEDKKYVYKDIKKAAKALPGIFSVGEKEAPEETEETMEAKKNKINSY